MFLTLGDSQDKKKNIIRPAANYRKDKMAYQGWWKGFLLQIFHPERGLSLWKYLHLQGFWLYIYFTSSCDPTICQVCVVKHNSIVLFRHSFISAGNSENEGRENKKSTVQSFGGNNLIIRVTLAAWNASLLQLAHWHLHNMCVPMVPHPLTPWRFLISLADWFSWRWITGWGNVIYAERS